jgi:hypothetical protein
MSHARQVGALSVSSLFARLTAAPLDPQFSVSASGEVGWTGEPTDPKVGKPIQPPSPTPDPSPFSIPRYHAVKEEKIVSPYASGGRLQVLGSDFVAGMCAETGLKAPYRSPQF